MAANSNIEWTDHTFNPWMGCTKVAPGCTNCYAEEMMDTRFGRVQWGPNGTRVRLSDSGWKEPLKWNRQAQESGRRARVFCASLADVFEDWDDPIIDHNGCQLHRHLVSGKSMPLDNFPMAHPAAEPLTMSDMRRDLFELIDNTPYLDWLLLTKRPENIRRMMPGRMENVWLVTSVSDQETVDRNLPELIACRDLSPVLGVSAEPLLDELSLWDYLGPGGIGWVIGGGESGPKARDCTIGHLWALVRECKLTGVPIFLKQLGAKPVNREGVPHPLKHPKGGDITEWPEDLRVREFPQLQH